MKVHAFIFTCERDTDLLKYSLLSLREIKKKLNKPDSLMVTLVFDKSERQLESFVYHWAGLGADDIRYTTFPRKGNLNGSECVAGMLETMANCAADDTDWLCQFDSDCILQDFNYFKAIKGSLGGEALGFSDAMGKRFACAGPGLCIKKDLALEIARLARTPSYAARIDKGPGYSDTMIGALADIAGYDCHCLAYESAELCPGSTLYRARVAQYFDGRLDVPNIPFCATSAIIHFDNKGAREMLRTDDLGEVHTAVREAMKDWYETRIKA